MHIVFSEKIDNKYLKVQIEFRPQAFIENMIREKNGKVRRYERKTKVKNKTEEFSFTFTSRKRGYQTNGKLAFFVCIKFTRLETTFEDLIKEKT